MSVLVKTEIASVEKIELKSSNGLVLCSFQDVGRVLIEGVPPEVLGMLTSLVATDDALELQNIHFNVEVDNIADTGKGYKSARYAGRFEVIREAPVSDDDEESEESEE